MPTYEYECQACGHKLEAFQRITETPLVDCPACQKPRLQRLISATAFQLKGGGWYKDGYGSSASTGKKPRTENDRIDRLQKAVDDDNKKTEASSAGTSDSASTSTASTTSSSTGGSSDS